MRLVRGLDNRRQLTRGQGLADEQGGPVRRQPGRSGCTGRSTAARRRQNRGSAARTRRRRPHRVSALLGRGGRHRPTPRGPGHGPHLTTAAESWDSHRRAGRAERGGLRSRRPAARHRWIDGRPDQQIPGRGGVHGKSPSPRTGRVPSPRLPLPRRGRSERGVRRHPRGGLWTSDDLGETLHAAARAHDGRGESSRWPSPHLRSRSRDVAEHLEHGRVSLGGRRRVLGPVQRWAHDQRAGRSVQRAELRTPRVGRRLPLPGVLRRPLPLHRI